MLNITAHVVSIKVPNLPKSTPPFELFQLLLIAAYYFTKKLYFGSFGCSRLISCQKSIYSSKVSKDKSCSPVNFFFISLSTTAFSYFTCMSEECFVLAAMGS